MQPGHGQFAGCGAALLSVPVLRPGCEDGRSAGAVRNALDAAAAGRASYRDALPVATAAAAGCTAILTEDLADGSLVRGVRILHPFAGGDLSSEAVALPAAG